MNTKDRLLNHSALTPHTIGGVPSVPVVHEPPPISDEERARIIMQSREHGNARSRAGNLLRMMLQQRREERARSIKPSGVYAEPAG